MTIKPATDSLLPGTASCSLTRSVADMPADKHPQQDWSEARLDAAATPLHNNDPKHARRATAVAA